MDGFLMADTHVKCQMYPTQHFEYQPLIQVADMNFQLGDGNFTQPL